MQRRQFLTRSSALIGAAGLTGIAHAIDPIQRNGTAKFKYSLTPTVANYCRVTQPS